MAAVGRFFGKFFGRTIGDAASFAIGGSISRTIDPVLQQVENEAWRTAVASGATRPLDAGTAAGIVAEDVERRDWGVDQAAQSGIGAGQFDALLGEALNAPGVGELFQAWRRDLIDDAAFTHGLRKAKLEPRWDGPLKALKDVLLSSEELAMMQQQGFVDEARANSEGALQGVTAERQQLRFEASGLPPGVETALQMLRRGIIRPDVFAQIVREGHTKTKYTDELLALEHVVLSANDYVTSTLRGWSDQAAMYQGGALTGHTREQMDTLYQNHGRPPSWHQIWIGLQRGGVYDGPLDGIDPAFLKGLRESDLRPEWYNLLWHSRYSYPAAFVLRTLTQSGDLTAAQAEEILKFEGWEPTLRATVAAKWAEGAAATTSSASKKAETSLLTALHSAYVNDRETEQTAREALAFLNTDPADADRTIAVWNRERRIVRSSLTAAQIKKAIGQPNRDKAWALERLAELGYTPADAETFLSE